MTMASVGLVLKPAFIGTLSLAMCMDGILRLMKY